MHWLVCVAAATSVAMSIAAATSPLGNPEEYVNVLGAAQCKTIPIVKQQFVFIILWPRVVRWHGLQV